MSSSSSSSSPLEPAPGSLAALVSPPCSSESPERTALLLTHADIACTPGQSLTIFSDLLSNLTHDLVLQAHRAEKLLRTQQQQHQLHLAALATTAAAPPPPPPDAASASAAAAAAATAAGTSLPPPPLSPLNEPKMPPGNPLATVPKELICTRCHLPRHTAQTLALGPSITTETGEKKKFCAKLPWKNLRGYDIYGNPCLNPNAPAKKGSAAAAAAKAGGSSGGQGSGTGGDSPASVGDDAPVKVGKGSGIVYVKCPSCDSDKIASLRFAPHLERCLGLSGRRGGRTALQKMAGSNGGSPMLGPADLANAKPVSSRKPSPEKLQQGAALAKAATPAPDDSVAVSAPHSLARAALQPAATAAAAAAAATAPPAVASATPKKKKKLGASAVGGGGGGLDTKESTPAPSLPPPALPPPPLTGSAAAKEKKRKRKDDLAAAAADPSKPKKQKTALMAKHKVPPSHAGSTGSVATATGQAPLAPFASPQKAPAGGLPSSSSATAAAQLAQPTPTHVPAALPKKPPPKPKGPKPKLHQPQPSSATGSPVVPKKTVPGMASATAAAALGKDGSPKKVKKVVKKLAGAGGGPGPGRPPGVSAKAMPGIAGKTVPGGGGGAAAGGAGGAGGGGGAGAAASVARKGLPGSGG